MDFIEHTFRPYESIDAVIRLLGRHNYTPTEMIPLREAFYILNGERTWKPGMSCKIPIQPEGTQIGQTLQL